MFCGGSLSRCLLQCKSLSCFSTPFTHTHNFVCCFQGLVFQSAFLQERTGRECIIHKLTRWMILLLALSRILYYHWNPDSPPWMKSGSQSRDTDLMGYWDKWKLGGWLLSDPSKQVIPESMKSATYTSHFIWAKSKCSILIQHMLAHDFEIRCGYRLLATTIPLLSYLLEYTHCTFEDLHNAEHHVSFEVSVFVCFETITTYFIAQSNLTYFLFISTFTCLSDRSFACPSALRPYKLGNCLCVSSSLASMRIERW